MDAHGPTGSWRTRRPAAGSPSQGMAALKQANRVRSLRAKLKDSLCRGEVTLASMFSDPPDFLQTAKVTTVLRAAPGLGPIRAAKIMAACRVSPAKTVAGLSERQRAALLEADGPSAELVLVLEAMASRRTVYDDSRAGIEFADRALAVAAQLGEPEPIGALQFRGIARCDLGDAGGLGDLQRALALATKRGSARDAVSLHFNLGAELWLLDVAEAALDGVRVGVHQLTLGCSANTSPAISAAASSCIAGMALDRLDQVGKTAEPVACYRPSGASTEDCCRGRFKRSKSKPGGDDAVSCNLRATSCALARLIGRSCWCRPAPCSCCPATTQ